MRDVGAVFRLLDTGEAAGGGGDVAAAFERALAASYADVSEVVVQSYVARPLLPRQPLHLQGGLQWSRLLPGVPVALLWAWRVRRRRMRVPRLVPRV